MKLFSFFKRSKPVAIELEVGEIVPVFWPDDYCQIQLVPTQNRDFIIKQIKEIDGVNDGFDNENGFTEIFVRGRMPHPIISQEIRIDYLEYTLEKLDFKKARLLRYEKSAELISEENTKIRAFINSEFTLFFDVEDEFVKNIWLLLDYHYSSKLSNILEILHILGIEMELILVDWNILELVDLQNKNQIKLYFNNRDE